MKIRYRPFNVEEDWEYVKARAVPVLVEDTCGIIAVDIETGRRVGAAIFDHLLEGSAQVHIMLDHPIVLKHGFMASAADYIFNYRNKKVVYGLTPSGNKKAIKFNKKVEFKDVYRIPNGYSDGVDLIIMQLLKEDCTYLPRIEEDV